MASYAAYQTQGDGTVLRLGTFTAPKGSVRVVTEAFARRSPNIDLSTIEFARRVRYGNEWIDDSPRVKAEPLPFGLIDRDFQWK
jgi:hypothetical protein